MEFLLVGTGGVLGAWARHLLGQRIETRSLDTLAVNVLGSLVFGFVLGTNASETLLFLVGVGFCGAFTTFSTFAFETVRLFETGDRTLAAANAIGTLVAAVLAVLVGMGVAGLVL